MNGETGREKRAAVLRACPIFSEMSPETEALLCGLAETAFSAGDVIAGGADGFPGIGIMLSGKASIYGRDSGRRVLLNRIAVSDVFGAATVFFSQEKSVSTVTATAKCRVLFIDRAMLETIIRNDFSVASAYIAFLSGKIEFLNRKIIAFTAKSADAALAGFLLENGGETDAVPANMSRLAATLGVGRTTLYRAVDALVHGGCIAYDGKEIRILDREALKKRI